MKDTPEQISRKFLARTGSGSVTMRKPERQPKVQIQVESEGDLDIEPDQDSREADAHKIIDPEILEDDNYDLGIRRTVILNITDLVRALLCKILLHYYQDS